MLYRRFGRSNLRMPVFSTGGMRYQQSFKDVPPDQIEEAKQRNLEATITHSIAVGINHIETARGYGSSERQLGLILPRYPRESLIVQTKIAPEKDPAVFRANFMESLERLQLDHVDLLAIHGINNRELLDLSIADNGCLAVCRELQQQGLARHIGVSTHAPLDVILDLVRTEKYGGFDYINLHWYYINQENWPAVEEATTRDMGVFIISPTDKGGMLYDPPEELRALTDPLHPIVFNDLFCLDRPEVHTLSLGAARPSDYDLHLEAVKLYDKRGDFLPVILERLARAMRNAVGPDWAERFREGLPRWENTPGQMNITVMLWLRNLRLAYGMQKYAEMRYNLLGNADHWFPGRNAQELVEGKIDQRELAAALAESPWKDGIPDLLRDAHARFGKEAVKRLSQSE